MILVIGSGVAGLSCALAAAEAGASVALVVPGRLGDGRSAPSERVGGSTALAQGGIAAAIGADDHPSAHFADTAASGVGLVDEEAAEVLVREGARLVGGLLREGFAADRGLDGAPLLGLEAAHGRARIVHAGGDRTGAALHAHLVSAVLAAAAAGRVELIEDRVASELVLEDGAVRGAVLRRPGGTVSGVGGGSVDASGGVGAGFGPAGAAAGALPGAVEGVRSAVRAEVVVRAHAVVLATGGYAALYERSTNPRSSLGEGVVLAARAGALVADLEFVQFHPTVVHDSGLLVSEAVRGAGAVLRDGAGERFMPVRHPLAELAPRDVVSREMQRVMRERGETHLWLDATGVERAGGSGTLARRFPGITAAVTARGIDWAREPVPVSPAAHYTMGGVASDLRGRSSVPGLFVAGETASTGVHGANRLASNSLLEGLVFGRRAGLAAAAFAARPGHWGLEGSGMAALVRGAVNESLERGEHRTVLREMIDLAAAARAESRGAHQRLDAPGTDPAQARRRSFAFTFSDRIPTPSTRPVPQRRPVLC